MASDREKVLEAVKALVDAALPNAKIVRNAKPQRLDEPGGLVLMFDGSPGEPEVDLSPVSYNYEHRIVLAFSGYESTTKSGSQVTDEMMQAVGAAIKTDPTLGGLCDWLEPIAPDASEIEMLGADLADLAIAGVMACYATDSPL